MGNWDWEFGPPCGGRGGGGDALSPPSCTLDRQGGPGDSLFVVHKGEPGLPAISVRPAPTIHQCGDGHQALTPPRPTHAPPDPRNVLLGGVQPGPCSWIPGSRWVRWYCPFKSLTILLGLPYSFGAVWRGYAQFAIFLTDAALFFSMQVMFACVLVGLCALPSCPFASPFQEQHLSEAGIEGWVR